MLGSVDFLLEPRALASVWHLDRSLQDDRPRVDAFVHEVNRDAGDLHAMLERLADCIETRERRQECRVDVDDPVPEPLDELSAQELHVSREHDQVDVTLGQPVPDRGVASLTVEVLGTRENRRLDPGVPGALERLRVGPVRNDRRDFDPVAVVEPVEDRLQVRPGPGDQDGDAGPAHPARGAAATAATCSSANLPSPSPSSPSGYSPVKQASQWCSRDDPMASYTPSIDR